MPQFIKHPKCGTTATHSGSNSWYCPKCHDWFKHGPSDETNRDRALKALGKLMPKLPPLTDGWH